jgi:hypothetical protein
MAKSDLKRILDETQDAPIVVSRVFPYQSFWGLDGGPVVPYDNETNVPQPAGKLIVSPEVREVAGYAVGLHPTAEAPIAIRFLAGQKSTPTPLYTLLPGQIVRPLGMVAGVPQPFAAFEWGLPWGWLGGGATPLWIFKSPDAKVDWGTARPEVCFHKTRTPVRALPDGTLGSLGSNFPYATSKPNWPTRFPWKNAKSYLGTAQGGIGNLSVQPTRTFIRLRNVGGSLAAPVDVLAVCRFGGPLRSMTKYPEHTDVRDNSDETAFYQMLTFPADPPVPAYAAALVPPFAGFTKDGSWVEVTDGPLARFGGDDANVLFFDMSDALNVGGTADLEIIRYGRI